MKRAHPKYALSLALCLAWTASQALGLEQKGAPDAPVATLSTYGMEVPTGSALRTVVPAGWKLFIHQSATLPETLSWKLGDAWPKVVSDMAQTKGLSVLIDWETKTVFVRTAEVAVQEAAVRAEIAQAATTPLPRVASEKKAQVSSQPEKTATAAPAASPAAAVTASASVQAQTDQDMARRQAELAAQRAKQSSQPDPVPVIRTNPTPSMVTAQEAAVQKNPPKMKSTAEFSYTQPVALNKPQARKVAQAVASKFGYRLVWAAEEVQLRGPVTLLARTAQEDVLLLQKAMGVFSPVVLEISDHERVVRALPRDLALRGGAAPARTAAMAAATGGPVSAAPVEALTAVVEPAAPAHAAAALPKVEVKAKAEPAAKPKLTLTVHEKQPLEDALLKFLREQGFTLEWKVTGGFEANRAMNFEGETVPQLLSQVLPPLGISADIYTRDKHIVIRHAEARDK